MFHVSFRYIFGIPPLILVLLPVASSDCDIEGKEGREYQHVLMISINDLLDTMIKNRTNCPNNEPKVLKKHACDDNKEGIFLYRAAHKLKQFVKVNDSEDFNLHLLRVSQGTLQLLNCTPKVRIKLPSQGEVQPTKNLEDNKSVKEQRKQKSLCSLGILLQKIKTCWNKILRGSKEH
ncbi:interleukin-7 isoform X2 [Enhydra lutris kenyoni]|uniref:Interleukin-7 n=1 Tax=Enhydra lutris kenyoni TaxID=391180 RepID=A0A2Y9KQN2_ENHLU|nr:interleukin-7 isoform X2 [Enhydra lutris kenyoni]